ncbi:MAG: GreA/GreB family elongation factor [Chitinophagaceae bacterium]
MKNKELTPVVMIEDDYRILKRYAGTAFEPDVLSLARELERADIVQKSAFPAHAIRLYSQISLVELKTKKQVEFEIVLPDDADMKQKKVSVLAPIAIAILGFRQGEEVICKLPGGTRRFLIEQVLNEPLAITA